MKKKIIFTILVIFALLATLAVTFTLGGCASDNDTSNQSGSHSSCH